MFPFAQPTCNIDNKLTEGCVFVGGYSGVVNPYSAKFSKGLIFAVFMG